MKKNIYLILLLIMGVFLFLPNGVKAEENYSIEATAGMEVAGNLKMILKGIPTTEEENLTDYYVYFCNDSDPAPTVEATTTLSPVETADYKTIPGWHAVISARNVDDMNPLGKISMTDDWYVVDGYTTAYVLKSEWVSSSHTNTLSQKITIKKPELFKKGQGYNFIIGDKTSMWEKESNIWTKFPANSGLTGKLNIKVGPIEDSTIIKKYVNNTSDAYSSLLSYAKSAKNGVTMSNKSPVEKFDSNIDKIVEGKHYYVLITTDDDTIRDLTDVYIRTGSNIGTLDDFSDNGYTGKQLSSKVENPKTGDYNMLIMVVVFIGAISILGISYNKFKKIK